MMKDLSVLQSPPFTDNGNIVELFADDSILRGIIGIIQRVNANAAA